MQPPCTKLLIGSLLLRTFASAATIPTDVGSSSFGTSSVYQSIYDSIPTSPDITNKSMLLQFNRTGTIKDNFEITCDSRLGRNLDVDDCLNALRPFEIGRQRVTFAERPPVPGTIPLPYRFMGPEASCVFQPILKPGATSGYTTMNVMRDATYVLITECAVRQKQGGIVKNLGGDDNLVLAIGSYGPNRPATENVQCRGQIEPESVGAFRKFISELPIGQTPRIFGPEADRRSSVKLPKTLNSEDGRTSMTVLTTNREGKGTYMTWYLIWEAAMAVFWKCLNKKMKGSHKGLGIDGDLVIIMNGR